MIIAHMDKHLQPCNGDYRYSKFTALGGSWLVRSGVISRLIIIITYIRGLVTLPIGL